MKLNKIRNKKHATQNNENQQHITSLKTLKNPKPQTKTRRLSPRNDGGSTRRKQACVRQQGACQDRPHERAFAAHVWRRQEEKPSEVERVRHSLPARQPVRHQVFHLISRRYDSSIFSPGGEGGDVGGGAAG